MLRQVRLGRPPLGDYTTIAELDGYLDREPYPERGTPDELTLARQLLDRAGNTPTRMAAVLAAGDDETRNGEIGNVVRLADRRKAR